MNISKLNSTLITLIISNKNFKRVTKQLAADMRVRKEDAQQELLMELIEHRLAKLDADTLTEALKGNDGKLNRNITFAYKDLRRKYFKAVSQQLATETDIDDLIIKEKDVIQPVHRGVSHFELQELNDFAFVIFKPKVAQFVLRYVSQGASRTQEAYGLSAIQIKKKLYYINRIIASRRNLIDTLLRTDDEMTIIEQLKLLTHIVFLIESDNYTDFVMHMYLDKVSQEDIIQDVLAMPGYRKSGLVIPNWGMAEHIKADEYNFINCVYDKVDELEKAAGITC